MTPAASEPPEGVGRLAHLFRFPVKSIGGEALAEAPLEPARPLPGDRRFGVLHADALRHLTDGALDRWLPKSAFLRGAAAAPLQAVRGGWDGADLVLTHPERGDLRFDPAGDDAPLIAWLEPLWAASGKSPAARLVEGPQALSDVNKPWVSILSLSSLALVEDRLGRPLGVDRWRGNLWVEGWAPLAERDLIGATIRIGDAELSILEPIGRCAATSADTGTGCLDGDTPAELEAAFGHQDFGVYAEVRAPGTIRPGDAVVVL